MERRDVPTSRLPHVVTSQRRDVGSTYIEVNKRQRRDVSASYASQSLKAKKRTRIGGSEIEERKTRAWKSKQPDLDLGEEPSFCIFFFSDRKTDVL